MRVPDQPVAITDRWQANTTFDLAQEPGDFIIQRGDGLIAYQIAVVVDDADQAITDVVRGVDLFDSTPRQIWLQELLGLTQPRYAHFPVVLGADRRKLSKQTGAPELDVTTPGANLTRALQAMGVLVPEALVAAPPGDLLDWALHHYDPTAFAGRRSFANKA